MSAYAYLRKSSVRDMSRDVSHEVQEAAVRELAARHGDADGLVILSDWDKSGRLGADKRPGYATLVQAIESGRATAVYSYSLSRLGRSVPELSRLIRDCDARGIPVRLYADPVDTSSASGRLMADILASVAAFEADVASERVRAANAAKAAKGQRVGTAKPYGDKPGEDAEAVLAAFHEAGTYSGAARLLNERGIAPRNGKKRKHAGAPDGEPAAWWPSSVRVVVRRLDPVAASRDAGRGVKAGTASDFTLARLLRCPTCGTRLTGTRDRLDGPNRGRVRYACRLGSVTPHARVSVSEHLIIGKVKEEAARLVSPETLEAGADPEGKRPELEARRARILDMYEAGDIGRDEKNDRLDRVDAAVRRLDAQRVARAIPAIDWEWEPRTLNRVLRALFREITLDPATFEPVAFEWTVPEWRRA